MGESESGAQDMAATRELRRGVGVAGAATRRGVTARGTEVRRSRFWLTERCKNWGGSRCGLVADPASHFGDGGRLDVAVNGVIAQRRMPTGWEAWAGCEVVGEGLKEEWWGAADDSADAEVRVHERLSHEIQTVEGWLRTGGCGVGERLGIGNDVLEGKEGVRVVSERVRNASRARLGHKATMGAIMGKWLPWRVLHSTRGYCDSPGTVGTADGYCRVLWVLRVLCSTRSTRGYCRVLWVLHGLK